MFVWYDLGSHWGLPMPFIPKGATHLPSMPLNVVNTNGDGSSVQTLSKKCRNTI